MADLHKALRNDITIYIAAWCGYVSFALAVFPVFNISTFLFSIALSMTGAWLYGFSGCLLTTALTIPFHYVTLMIYADNSALLYEAFNPFGITVQLSISLATAYLRATKDITERLNAELENIIEERTRELDRLQRYIIQNHETSQILLSRMLLGDLGDSLSVMHIRAGQLLDQMVSKNSPVSQQLARLTMMLNDCVSAIKNLEFVDTFFTDKHTDFLNAIRAVADHFKQTANVVFDIALHIEHGKIPKHTQHQLYRITREAITNAVRHAKAQNIHIQLDINDDNYALNVTNDGLPMPDHLELGLGMKLMQQRSHEMNGSIKWEKRTEGGTRLHCSIPKISG